MPDRVVVVRLTPVDSTSVGWKIENTASAMLERLLFDVWTEVA
jgi:hypothetical protein